MSEVASRFRVQYSKSGPIRFIGHRDLARVWDRALRRARVPIAFSEGFTPHPKISFGLALPVGWESRAEYLDMSLTEPRPVAWPASVLNPVLPDGIRVTAVRPVGRRAPSLSSIVGKAAYTVWFSGPDADPGLAPEPRRLGEALEAIIGSESLIATRIRKGEEVESDLRPLIFDLSLLEDSPENRASDGGAGDRDERFGVPVHMKLATRPRVLRPEELAALMTERGMACEASLVRRESQLAAIEGTPFDPMHQEVLGEAGAA